MMTMMINITFAGAVDREFVDIGGLKVAQGGPGRAQGTPGKPWEAQGGPTPGPWSLVPVPGP
eukprot:12417209-Karenia_brevis.AAC.1